MRSKPHQRIMTRDHLCERRQHTTSLHKLSSASWPPSSIKNHHVNAGFMLLVVAILTAPSITSLHHILSLERVLGASVSALAATCLDSGRGGVQQVAITPNTIHDLSTAFDCEGGQFEVSWLGTVSVPRTIHIGRNTTVKIVGGVNKTITAGTTTTSSGVDLQLEELLGKLALPEGLTSTAVGPRPSNPVAEDYQFSFGPIFFVDNGQLFLENMVIRDGFAINSTINPVVSGGGVHAIDSNVTVTGCEFEDNFADFWGGGIFANQSTLTVIDSVFRGCHAGFQSFAGEEDVAGAGGGIVVRIFNARGMCMKSLSACFKFTIRGCGKGIFYFEAAVAFFPAGMPIFDLPFNNISWAITKTYVLLCFQFPPGGEGDVMCWRSQIVHGVVERLFW